MAFNRGQHYEETLVHAIILDHGFAEQMLEVLDTNYLSLEYLKEVIQTISNYHKEFKTFPSFKLLGSIIYKETSNELVRHECISFLKKTENVSMNGDLEYVKRSSLDFCRKRSLLGALNKVLELAEESNYEQVVSVVQKSLELGAERNIGHVYSESVETRLTQEARVVIPTGWGELDKQMGGGLGRGEIGTIIAPSGFGKSHALVNVGASAAKAGFSVVVYSFELSEKHLGNRYDSYFSGVPIGEIPNNKDKIRSTIAEMQPKLIIKSYPTKSASIMTVRNHLSKLRLRNFVPDLLVVDYADIMRSTKNYDSKRFEHESVYEDLRGLAMELNCAVWTASQTNRSAIDDEVISLSKVSESYGKIMVSDFAATMSRRYFYVAKSRSGPDNLVHPYIINTTTSKMELMPSMQPDLIERITVTQDDEDKARMRQRIKEFMKDYEGEKGDN